MRNIDYPSCLVDYSTESGFFRSSPLRTYSSCDTIRSHFGVIRKRDVICSPEKPVNDFAILTSRSRTNQLPRRGHENPLRHASRIRPNRTVSSQSLYPFLTTTLMGRE